MHSISPSDVTCFLIAWAFGAIRVLPIAVMLPSAFAQSATRRWTVLLTVGLSVAVATNDGRHLDAAKLPSQRNGDSFGQAVSNDPQTVVSASGESGAIASIADRGLDDPMLLLHVAIREFLLGLAIGLGFAILLSGLQVAAAILSQMTGLRWSAATATDPVPGEATTLQRYFGLLTVAVFISSGAYRDLFSAVLDSFVQFPVGSALPQFPVARTLADLLLDSFAVGIRCAAPVVFCLLLSMLMISTLARSSPVLGAMGVNLAANVLVMLVACWASVGVVATTFQNHWTAGVTHVVQILREAAG